jgi:hypothetical protein
MRPRPSFVTKRTENEMDDVLLNPVELTESELQEVAGGTGCGTWESCHSRPHLAFAAAAAVAVATPCGAVAVAGAVAIAA